MLYFSIHTQFVVFASTIFTPKRILRKKCEREITPGNDLNFPSKLSSEKERNLSRYDHSFPLKIKMDLLMTIICQFWSVTSYLN